MAWHSEERCVITPQLRAPDLPGTHAYTLSPGHPTPGPPNFLRPPIASIIGAGILTRFPSATAFALTLGADSPSADERGGGNLGLSASEPFTRFIATHVSIRTSDTSSSLLKPPSPAYGTLSYRPGVRSQRTEVRNSTPALFPTSINALQHLRDCLVLVAPTLPCLLINVTKIVAVAHPYPHLICRTNRHLNEPLELCC